MQIRILRGWKLMQSKSEKGNCVNRYSFCSVKLAKEIKMRADVVTLLCSLTSSLYNVFYFLFCELKEIISRYYSKWWVHGHLRIVQGENTL